jgi:hypothetical protein
MDLGHLAQKVLVFDDQHNQWTNKFASIYDCSSQNAKVTWTKALRKATPQNKILWRSQVKINKYQAKSKKRRKVLPLADCPVEDTGLSGGTPDCPLPHVGLSGAPGNSSPTTSSWWHYGGGHGLSGAKAYIAMGRLTDPTASGAPDRAPDCPVPTTGLSGVL